LRGDALERPSQLDLGLEQPVALAAVFARLAGKADVVLSGQGRMSLRRTPR
jgi:hypothetical protein